MVKRVNGLIVKPGERATFGMGDGENAHILLMYHSDIRLELGISVEGASK